MALLGPERRRPTVFYSSSFSVWRGLVGSGAGPRRSRRCPLSRCRRAAPQRSGGNPPPRCRQGGASAEPAMSSASLLVGRGLGGAGGVLCLVVGAAGPRRSRASPTPMERALVGAGIILCLVLGLAKQRLARFIALFVGGRNLCHLHAVPPVREAALAGERQESSSASCSARSAAICSSAYMCSWRRWWL